MNDYISREAAISKIRDEGVLGGDYDAYEREEDVVNTLKSIPAADVVEVRHGRWCEVENGESGHLCECSACKEWMLFYYDFVANYCPSCGAKMDGGQDDV